MESHKLLSDMSHEIRTQMNSIVGLSYLIEGSSNEAKNVNRYSDQLYKKGNRLLRLFEDFFDTAISEKYYSRIGLIKCNLKSAAEEIFSGLREFLEQEYKSIIFLITESNYLEEVDIIMDKTKVSRILHYIFQNAIINTKVRYIKVGYRYSEGSVIFYVLDSQHNYFQSKEYFNFSDSESSMTKSNNPGSALNITLAKKNVKILGGKIWVEPYDTHGTGIYFSIPVRKVKPGEIFRKNF